MTAASAQAEAKKAKAALRVASESVPPEAASIDRRARKTSASPVREKAPVKTVKEKTRKVSLPPLGAMGTDAYPGESSCGG